nr:hypothetical protein [Gordonia oryzae]
MHVLLMHALVNEAFEKNGRWDATQWGLLINQTDLGSTLNLFSGALMMGVRTLGVPVDDEKVPRDHAPVEVRGLAQRRRRGLVVRPRT